MTTSGPDFHTHGPGCSTFICTVQPDELLAEMLWLASMFGMGLYDAFASIDAQQEPLVGTLAETKLQQARWMWSPTSESC